VEYQGRITSWAMFGWSRGWTPACKQAGKPEPIKVGIDQEIESSHPGKFGIMIKVSIYMALGMITFLSKIFDVDWMYSWSSVQW
jgi:hypothetical protein